MTLILCVILCGLAFEYINGFHDTANAIATVVSTRVLSPRQAVVMAAVCNLLGALWGTAVATTIGSGLVAANAVTLHTLLCAVLAAIIWNLFTWWLGLPSSSSHALIGGLCGATVASAYGDLSVVRWYSVSPDGHGVEGIWPKVVVPMIVSPLLGLILGFLVMGLLLVLLRNWRPHRVNTVFGKLQLASASLMGLCHGTNDAQNDDGHHYPGVVHRNARRRFRRRANLAGVPAYTAVRGPFLGEAALLVNNGGRHDGRRLANHQDVGPPHGQVTAHPRFRRRNDCGPGDPDGQPFRYPSFHHARDFFFHHGRGSDPAAQCREVDGGRPHALGLDPDPARHRRIGLLAAILAARTVAKSRPKA